MLFDRSFSMYYIIIFTVLLLTTFCDKKQSTPLDESILKYSDSTSIPTFTDSISISSTGTPKTSSQEIDTMISNLIDFKLGDEISLDSPKKFLQISILFTLSQNSNYYIISQKKNTTDEDVNAYMNKKREDFYTSLGISETEYIQYGITHSKNIQEFLATTNNINELYEIIQAHVVD